MSPIRERGYTRYDGPRLPPRNRYRVLAGRTLSLAWASGLVKTILIIGMFPMVICAVVMYFKIRGAHFLQEKGLPLPEAVQHPEYWIFNCIYWCQLWFAFAMSVVVAAPAISDDLRTGAFQFYFSRPLTRAHYVLGKLLGVSTLILIVSAGPGLLLALMRVVLASSGSDALAQLPTLLATILYGAIYAGTMILPALALSSLSKQSGHAMGGWAAIFFLPWVLGEGTAAATGLEGLALVSIPTNLRLLGQYLFQMERSYTLAWYWPAAVLVALLAGSALLLWRRLDGLEAFS